MISLLRAVLGPPRKFDPSKVKKPRKRPTYVETPIHIAIVEWLEVVLPKTWIVHHSPNTRKLSPQTGKLFRRMGTKAGFPDIMIIGTETVPYPGVPGKQPAVYFIEVKTTDERKSKPSVEQAAFMKKLEWLGFNVCYVARSIDDARRLAYEWKLPIRETRAR